MGYAMVITASIAAIASIANTVLSILLRRFLTPPSGGTAGKLLERTHALSAVSAAGVTAIARRQVEDDLLDDSGSRPPAPVKS